MGEFIEILRRETGQRQLVYGHGRCGLSEIYSIGSEQPKHVSFSPHHITDGHTGRCCSSTTNAGGHYAGDVVDTTGGLCAVRRVEVDGRSRITGFDEKPKETKIRSPYNPAMVSVRWVFICSIRMF